MHISERFQKVLGATLASIAVITAALFITLCINPPAKVGAQNAGNTGTFTAAQLVFTNMDHNGSSAILQNIGQSSHFLTYCTLGFGGTIDLEASYTGTSSWTVIASATYGQNSVVDTGCHVLQAGGYFQNVKATVSNFAAGSVSAWYSSSSGPVAFAPSALGSNGPIAPVACDTNTNIAPSPSTTTLLVGVLAGTKSYLCQVSISFNATPSIGTITFEEATDATCGTIVRTMWQLQVTANSPQSLPLLGGPLGAFTRTTTPGHAVCVAIGAVTAQSIISLSYAQF